MRCPNKARFRFLQRQAGFTLIEILFAVGILALIGTVFMTSLGTAHKNIGMLDEQTQAEALIRSQLEIIKDSPYLDSGNYTALTIDLPSQYSMSINVGVPSVVSANTTTLQEITVSVSRPTGDGGYRPILSVSTYKAKE